jgi:hypothetical protein
VTVPYLAPPPPPSLEAHATRGREVVDLGPTVTATRVVLDRDLSALDRLDAAERRRLLVRVLCGLVAYDEQPAPARLAG